MADNGTEEVLISIHAPRTGSDAQRRLFRLRHLIISIHAPRTGSDTDSNFLLRNR